MIELVLEIRDDAEEAAIRGLVGKREGITLIGPAGPHLEERADVNTLLMEDWVAVDLYVGQVPSAPGWVVVDAEQDIRVFLHEAAISPINKAYVHRVVEAFWIVSIPHTISPQLADGGDPAAIRDAERGEQYMDDRDVYFERFLNAFEVMERHNTDGTLPPIHRVGIWAFVSWLPGLLRAYDTYRERALAGAYGPQQEPPDDQSGA